MLIVPEPPGEYLHPPHVIGVPGDIHRNRRRNIGKIAECCGHRSQSLFGVAISAAEHWMMIEISSQNACRNCRPVHIGRLSGDER